MGMTVHAIPGPQSLHSLLLVHHEMTSLLLHLPITVILCLALNQQDLDVCIKISTTMGQNQPRLSLFPSSIWSQWQKPGTTICFRVHLDLNSSESEAQKAAQACKHQDMRW